MKRMVIASAVGGLLLATVISVSVATTPNAAAAEADEPTVVEMVDLVLARLVDAGILSEEKADALRAKIHGNERFQTFAATGLPEGFDAERFEERLDRRLDRAQEMRERFKDADKDALRKRFEQRKNQHTHGGAIKDQLADIPPDELKEAIQNGTLSELVDAEEVVDSLLAQAEERLTRAVEAGRISQEKADAHLAELEAKLAPIASGESDLSELMKRHKRHGAKGAWDKRSSQASANA